VVDGCAAWPLYQAPQEGRDPRSGVVSGGSGAAAWPLYIGALTFSTHHI